MKVIVCYKLVPNADEITVNADRTLKLSAASPEIGQYDLRAVEEGVKLAAATGGEAVALTVGGEVVANSKMKKAILSRGPAKMIAVQDDKFAKADSLRTAKALKGAVEKEGADLVVCGEGSSDEYNQQVGNMLGALLGWNCVNSVSKLEAADGKLRLERTVEDGVEVLEVALPAVISVTSDINTPRIPSMKDILGAGKKPSETLSANEVGGIAPASTAVKSVLAPKQKDRQNVIIEKADDAGIAEFVGYIRKAL